MEETTAPTPASAGAVEGNAASNQTTSLPSSNVNSSSASTSSGTPRRGQRDKDGNSPRRAGDTRCASTSAGGIDRGVSQRPNQTTSMPSSDANSSSASTSSGTPRRGQRDRDPRSSPRPDTRCASTAVPGVDAGVSLAEGGGVLPQKRTENPEASPNKGGRRQKQKSLYRRPQRETRKKEDPGGEEGSQAKDTATTPRSPNTAIAGGSGSPEPSAIRPTRLTNNTSYNNDASATSSAGGSGALGSDAAASSDDNSGVPPPGDAAEGESANASSETAPNVEMADATPNTNSSSSGSAKKKVYTLSTENISTWSRKDTFVPKENYYEPNEMADFEADFNKEIQQQFRARTTSAKKRLRQKNDVGIGKADNTNASLAINLDLLSRLHWEDIATQHDGESSIPFRVFIARQNNDERWKYKQAVFDAQQKMGLGVERRVFGGREFFGLYAVMLPNGIHRSIKAGELPLRSIKDLFVNGKGGFALKFEGVPTPKAADTGDVTMQFEWRDMVDSATDVLIFGAKKDTSRIFWNLFRDKTDTSYIHHIYRQMADETRGDVSAANAVSSAYFQKRMVVSEEERLQQEEKHIDSVVKSEISFLGPEKTKFFDEVDDTFEKAIKNSMVSFQDYSESIVMLSAIAAFVAKCQLLFPGLWLLLCTLRNIRPNVTRGKELIPAKHLQVFFTILALARMADQRRLTYWSLVSSFAMCGWGVKNKAQAFTCFWGNTCSVSTRNRKMKELAEKLLPEQIKLLSSCKALILVYDNFQRGQHLLYQRGGHSSTFLSGTHQLAAKVHEFVITLWDKDDCKVDMTYLEQVQPSPAGMPRFEDVDTQSPEALSGQFLLWDFMEREEVPDFSGKRVKNYCELAYTATIICYVWSCFAAANVWSGTRAFVDAKIDKMHKLVRSEALAELFKGAKHFQEQCVETWNPKSLFSTLTVMLGFLGLKEESAKECGSISLDQLYRMGILVEKEDGTWELAPNWKERRAYLFGDAKTVENIAKFVRELASRPLSYDEQSHQADIFLDAMSVVMQLPGDWHAGLAMLQSIYSLFYRGFLEPFKDALSWQRVNIDVRGCYFQASRLAGFVADELMRALMYEFASGFEEFDTEVHGADPSVFVCKFALEFIEFLRGLKSSDDEWRRACALFLLMYIDFRNFVNSYRIGDSVTILRGYENFAPVWQKLGQTKYVERHFHQYDQLLRDFPYSQYMESMLNRCVRSYPRESGKRMVAWDEFLELKNKTFSEFPMVKTLMSLVRLGDFLGPIERCKQFVSRFYVIRKEDSGKQINRSSTEPSMVPEKKLIFEAFMKLGTVVHRRGRKFVNSLVWDIKPKLKTVITRAKLEASKKDSGDHSYNRLYSSISQILPSARAPTTDELATVDFDAAEASTAEDGVVDGGNEEEEEQPDEDEEMGAFREDLGLWDWEAGVEEQESPVDKKGFHKLHKYILHDLWTEGNAHFKTLKLGEVRAAAKERAARMRKVHHEILFVVRRMQAKAGQISSEPTAEIPMQPFRSFIARLRAKTGLTNVLAKE